MLLPMSPTSSAFLIVETRERPMHVGSLQLFEPPPGADALDVRRLFDAAMSDAAMLGDDLDAVVAPLFRKRARRSITSLGQWGWEQDPAFDLEHHVRRNALPHPGRILELLALCSRLHSTLLDRHRPLWEMHLVEGLADGRFAIYTKMHHALVDGVSALRLLSRMYSRDRDERNMAPPWAPQAVAPPPTATVPPPTGERPHSGGFPSATWDMLRDAAGLPTALIHTLRNAVNDRAASLSLSAPQTMLNVPITGSRRFAAQSWPIERIRDVGKASDCTVNDVILAMCSGALRHYLADLDALPDEPLIAMVPVSLHVDDAGARGDGGGNAIGEVMCNLGTQLADPAARLSTVHHSMLEGKELLQSMGPVQILAMSALGVSPAVLWPLLGLTGTARPPFNLVISNIPGPREQRYWNGARLDGLYPLSIPLDGQALNITCTSYAADVAFGLTGCRRTLPHLQRLLTHLDRELSALEEAVGV